MNVSSVCSHSSVSLLESLGRIERRHMKDSSVASHYYVRLPELGEDDLSVVSFDSNSPVSLLEDLVRVTLVWGTGWRRHMKVSFVASQYNVYQPNFCENDLCIGGGVGGDT